MPYALRLGAKVEAFDEAGRSVIGAVGELVVTAPMPSMPVGFWGDPGGERYRASGQEQFPPHVDVSNANTMHRMLAVLLYLNEVPEGGATNFGRLGVEITPKPGRLLLFPPIWLYPHAGLPPQRGEKYILGTYLTYVDPRALAR